MLIKYIGTKKEVNTNCAVCGNKNSFYVKYLNKFFPPSGREIIFKLNEIKDVKEIDYNFLMEYFPNDFVSV